jgi:hypothetical protein
MLHRALIVVAVMAFASLCPRTAGAQAWVPAKGEGSVAVLVQDLFVKDHYFDRGQKADRGQIRSNSLLADVTYGLTDRLALTVAVPFIRTQYSGTAPHPTAQDDGRAHTGVQDLRFAARYNVVQGALTITPFVGTNVPTHNYEYFAHAAYGARVRELEVGTYVGRVLSPALPKAFIQARYSYSFAQKIVGVDHNRSNLDLEFGYFLTPAIRVFTLGAGHKTHGGISVTEAGWRALPPEQGPHHDRIGRIDLLDAGGGIQMSVTSSLDLFGSYMKSLAGRNTHAIDRAITVGASWSFGRSLRALMIPDDAPKGSSKASESSRTASTDEGGGRRLIRCLCQK